VEKAVLDMETPQRSSFHNFGLVFYVGAGFESVARLPDLLQLIAWLSFLFTLLLLWLQPAKRAKAYADAWRMLDDAYGRYKTDASYNSDKVFDARKEGERLISFTDPS